MAQQVVSDLVDLALDFFELCSELGERRGAADQLFPPAAAAAYIEFGN